MFVFVFVFVLDRCNIAIITEPLESFCYPVWLLNSTVPYWNFNSSDVRPTSEGSRTPGGRCNPLQLRATPSTSQIQQMFYYLFTGLHYSNCRYSYFPVKFFGVWEFLILVACAKRLGLAQSFALLVFFNNHLFEYIPGCLVCVVQWTGCSFVLLV